MQIKNIEGFQFQLQASGGKAEHIQGLEQALGSISTSEDIIFHCQNKSTISTNKMPLIFSSQLFAKLITENCHCPSALFQIYDVICPDFDPDCMARVLELISNGATNIDVVDQHIYNGMLFILDSLQINIKLEEIWAIAPTINLKIQTASTSDQDSSPFDSSIQDQQKKAYTCKICSKEFHLLFGLQNHLKQHPSLSRTEDSVLDQIDQEERLSKEDLTMDTPDMEVDLSTLVNLSPSKLIDDNNLFHCHECSTEVTSFEAFEKHTNNHFMEIENENNASTKNSSAVHKTKGEDFDKVYQPDNDKTVVDKKVKGSWEKEQGCKDSNATAMHSCPICPATVPSLNRLGVHIAASHFKQQLLKSYTTEGPTACKFCVRSYASCSHLLRHVVQKHHALKNILPKDVYQKFWDIRIPNNTKDHTIKIEDASDKSNPDQYINVVIKKEVEKRCEKKQDGKDGNGVLIRHCPICPTIMTRVQHMHNHVGSKHFKQQILESYVGQDPNTCKKCGRSFGKSHHLMSHIVMKHRALKYIAPEDVYQKLESMKTPNYRTQEKLIPISREVKKSMS